MKETKYEGYSATETGEVYSFKKKTMRKLAPEYIRSGYIRYKLSVNGVTIRVLAHRLVYETYIGEIPDKLFVNHKDGNKRNNHVDNLELVSNQENVIHAVKNNLIKVGEEHISAKISDDTLLSMLEEVSKGVTPRSISLKHNVSQSYLYRILEGTERPNIWDKVKERGINLKPGEYTPYQLRVSDDLIIKMIREVQAGNTCKSVSLKYGFDGSYMQKIMSKKRRKDIWDKL